LRLWSWLGRRRLLLRRALNNSHLGLRLHWRFLRHRRDIRRLLRSNRWYIV
jgi:hypothetical protein